MPARCAEHIKAAALRYRADNLDAVRAHDLARAVDPRRKARLKATITRRRGEVPGYTRAHKAVARALLSGVLVRRDCEVCGRKQSHAHHDSYRAGYELRVRWLCPPHHAQWHRDHEVEV
jgi:hypothetical protein